MVDRMDYRILDAQGQIVRDLMIDLDRFDALKVGDIITTDDGRTLRITGFRRIAAETREVLTERADEE
jgi:hypothetical protein